MTGTALATLDWPALAADLDLEGFAVTPPLLDRGDCEALRERFDEPIFRSSVDMARHNFGRGTYRYFERPLPEPVQTLRRGFYPPLASIANRWAERLGQPACWPAELAALTEQCALAGQTRPTPLLLRYGPDDFNCLHQDLYGEIQFPLQVIVLLSAPGKEFDGGELVLVEQRPRMQSRPAVVPLTQGCAAVIPVRERPRLGSRGYHRTAMRHGVSRVRRGSRSSLGLIFHDAR